MAHTLGLIHQDEKGGLKGVFDIGFGRKHTPTDIENEIAMFMNKGFKRLQVMLVAITGEQDRIIVALCFLRSAKRTDQAVDRLCVHSSSLRECSPYIV